MQTVSVVGILCSDSRSPADIRLSIQEALSEGKLVSLNLRSAADALQTLHNIISPNPEQQTLRTATATAAAAAVTAAHSPHNQNVVLLSAPPTLVALDVSSRSYSLLNVRAQRRLLLEAELTSPLPSPRDPLSPPIAASDLPCPPATLAVSEAILESNDGSSNSGSTIVPSAEFHHAVVLAAQIQPHAARSFQSTEPLDFTQGLIALNLSECRSFDARSLKSASTLLSSVNLQTIVMDSCGIDDDGAAALASTLSSYPALRTLNLRHNSITDVGAKRLLVAARSHMKLQTIVCDGCRVSVRLQRALWDLSEKRGVSDAHKSPSLQLAVPVSHSRLSGIRETMVSPHRQSAGTAVCRSTADPVPAVQHVSGCATERQSHRASSYASFMVSRPRRSTNFIPTCASAPVSPVARPPVGSQPGSATSFRLCRTHARRAVPLSRFESDDDSAAINQFIQSRRRLSNVDQPTTDSPQLSLSPGNSSASCGAGIDDLLEACATMQDQAGIPVPLHFNRRTPLHEIRAFMRREQLKRDKTSPARLLRNHKNPAEKLESMESPAPGNLQSAASADAPPQRKASPDEEHWSRICAVGVSSSDLTPRIASALMHVPFSDVDAEESALVRAASDEGAYSGAHDEDLSALYQPLDHGSTHVQSINCPTLPSSPPLLPRALETSLPTSQPFIHPLLLQTTIAEPLSPRQLGAPLVHQHEAKATDGMNYFYDQSILWAKKVDVMIRTSSQGSLSLPD